MILETIITSLSPDGTPYLAPMGVHAVDGEMLIMPYRPSRTLDNILATGHAVMNHIDDVRVFAGCLTGRRDWPVTATERVPGWRLACALSHAELELVSMEEHELRPKLHCRVVHEANHAPFRGFNRAQFAVLEAAILASRVGMLPWEKIAAELAYLRIGLEKTAGERENEAWSWLMEKFDAFRQGQVQETEIP